MKAYLVAIAAVGLLAVACKSKKEMAVKTPAKADSVVAVVPPTPVGTAPVISDIDAAPTDSIRLNVSFYSPGSGINYLAARKLDAFLTKYESENPGAVTVYKSAWGREGEVDYCFKMNDATKGNDFATQVYALLKGEDRINYKENTTCRKARF